MTNKRDFAINLLKEILAALHEKRFADVVNLVDECTLSVDDIIECVQGTVELNEFDAIDEYREKNIAYITDEDSEPFQIDYYIEADGGNDIPLIIQLKTESRDGSRHTILDIEP